jgi:hypothetical protein
MKGSNMGDGDARGYVNAHGGDDVKGDALLGAHNWRHKITVVVARLTSDSPNATTKVR